MHQYVLLLALVQAQKGPTAKGRESMPWVCLQEETPLPAGIPVQDGPLSQGLLGALVDPWCQGTCSRKTCRVWQGGKVRSQRSPSGPGLAHVSREARSASAGCRGWSMWGPACCTCRCSAVVWAACEVSSYASAPATATPCLSPAAPSCGQTATPLLASPPWSLLGTTDPEPLLLLPESCEHSTRDPQVPRQCQGSTERGRTRRQPDSGSHVSWALSHPAWWGAVPTPATGGRAGAWRPLCIWESDLSKDCLELPRERPGLLCLVCFSLRKGSLCVSLPGLKPSLPERMQTGAFVLETAFVLGVVTGTEPKPQVSETAYRTVLLGGYKVWFPGPSLFLMQWRAGGGGTVSPVRQLLPAWLLPASVRVWAGVGVSQPRREAAPGLCTGTGAEMLQLGCLVQ